MATSQSNVDMVEHVFHQANNNTEETILAMNSISENIIELERSFKSINEAVSSVSSTGEENAVKVDELHQSFLLMNQKIQLISNNFVVLKETMKNFN